MNAPMGSQTSWGQHQLARLREQHERRKTGYLHKPLERRYATPDQHRRKRWGAGWDRTEHPSIARKRRLGMIR